MMTVSVDVDQYSFNVIFCFLSRAGSQDRQRDAFYSWLVWSVTSFSVPPGEARTIGLIGSIHCPEVKHRRAYDEVIQPAHSFPI